MPARITVLLVLAVAALPFAARTQQTGPGGIMKALQLSRIGGRWAIGPVQLWWLDLESLDDRRKSFTSRTDFLKEREKLYDSFPACLSHSTHG